MKRAAVIILVIAICITSGIAGFLVGRHTAPQTLPAKYVLPNLSTTTFYATITAIHEKYIQVQGLEINDINSRGAFDLSIGDATVLEWRGTTLQLSELDVGDTIAVTYTGDVLESYPAQITDVLKIQLLDDEK